MNSIHTHDWVKIMQAIHEVNGSRHSSIVELRALISGVYNTLSAVLNPCNYDMQQWEIHRKFVELLPKDIHLYAIPKEIFRSDSRIFFKLDRITNFPKLMASLPECEKQNGIKNDVFSKYLFEMGQLQTNYNWAAKNSNQDPAGLEAYFTQFSKHGSQYIAEFGLVNRSIPIKDQYNWHGSNTSQWIYAGGMLVQNGRVSLHH